MKTNKLVLLADDHKEDSVLLCQGLMDIGFQVDCIDSAEAALEKIREHKYDLAILDWVFPDETIDGLTLLREMRQLQPGVPIIMLTAKIAAGNLSRGLDCGADIYIKKPFVLAEVIAYAKSLTNKSRLSRKRRVYKLKNGPLELNLYSHEVHLRGRLLKIRGKKYQLLRYLMLHKGEVVSRTELTEKVWGASGVDVMCNNLDVQINGLRNLLGSYGSKYLTTLRRVGYRLEIVEN